MPGIDKLEQEQGEATPASDQNIKNVLLQAFSSLSNTATSTPAAKQHQMIIFMGRLLGWSHCDDLPSRLKTLPYMEQCMHGRCYCASADVGSCLATTLAAISWIYAWKSSRKLHANLASRQCSVTCACEAKFCALSFASTAAWLYSICWQKKISTHTALI